MMHYLIGHKGFKYTTVIANVETSPMPVGNGGLEKKRDENRISEMTPDREIHGDLSIVTVLVYNASEVPPAIVCYLSCSLNISWCISTMIIVQALRKTSHPNFVR